MASLSDLLALQRRERTPNERPNTFARVAEGAIQGAAAGYDAKKEKQKNELDTYIKILDLQEKVNRIQAERENQVATRNMAKALGLMPHDEGDLMMGRDLAGQTMTKPAFEKPSPATNVGKMEKMFEDFAPSLSMGKDGMRIGLRKRYPTAGGNGSMTPSQIANVSKSRLALAVKIYNSDHPERQTKDLMDRPIPYNPTSYELQKSGALKAADSILSGNIFGYDKYVEDTQDEDFLLRDTDVSKF